MNFPWSAGDWSTGNKIIAGSKIIWYTLKLAE